MRVAQKSASGYIRFWNVLVYTKNNMDMCFKHNMFMQSTIVTRYSPPTSFQEVFFTVFHANTAVYLKAQIMKTKRKLLVKSKALPRRREDPR